MSTGFYKRRRGVVEHVDAGTIDLLELGVHDYLNLKANLLIDSDPYYPAGVCVTSAVALCSLCGRISERTMQRILSKLERIGWIKTWKTPGKRGNYVVLICRASVHNLSGTEYRVNGEATTDWRRPIYERVGEVSGSCPPVVLEVATLRERRIEKREEKTPSGVSPSAIASLESETRSAAFAVFWEHWPRKEAKSAASRAWSKIPVAEYPPIMVGLEKWILSDQWKRGVIPHPATWLNGKRWQDEDIPQFVGGSDGKVTSFSERRSQKAATAINTVLGRLEKASGDIHRALPPANE